MARDERLVTVALTGTSCTGKSSVAKGVKLRLGDECVAVDEAARDFFRADPNERGVTYEPEMGDDRFSYDVQSRIQLKHLNRMAVAGSHARALLDPGWPYEGGVTRIATIEDRTPFDAAVCVAANGDPEGAEKLFDEARWWVGLKPYDHLYLLNPDGVPYVNDPERPESLETRQLMHETFLGFLAGHSIAFTLLSGTEEERIERVVGDINNSWANAAPLPTATIGHYSLSSGPLEAVHWYRTG